MENPGGGGGGNNNNSSSSSSSSNVPAFLTKLWTLVEDADTDALICWSPSGNSFHVFDQGQFAKEVLPKYFKHNNMASFVRQLNMYGFRKVIHIEQGGLVKPEKDDTEFQHPYFLRGQEHLLENIKRKVTNVAGIKSEDIKVRQDSMTKLLTDVQMMKGKQESMDSKLIAMKQYQLRLELSHRLRSSGTGLTGHSVPGVPVYEGLVDRSQCQLRVCGPGPARSHHGSLLPSSENEALWREVAGLRQKHAQQQKVVNKLIQFLISLVQSNRILGVKRKIPLMLNDSSSSHPLPKYGRQYSLEHVHGPSPFAASSPAYGSSARYSPDSSGPIISDVTELAQSSPSASPCSSLNDRSSPVIHIKEEPPSPSGSPQVERAGLSGAPATEAPLSPATFIDSILQEEEPSSPSPTAGNAVLQPPPPREVPQRGLPGQSTAQLPCPGGSPFVAWGHSSAPESSRRVFLLPRLNPSASSLCLFQFGSHSADVRRHLPLPQPFLFLTALQTTARDAGKVCQAWAGGVPWEGEPERDWLAGASGTEFNEHLDTMDSSLDKLQTMLSTHGFSVDTSALLDLFSPSMTVADTNLPDLDSSLASIQDLLSSQEQQKPAEAEASPGDTGKQLVQYTAQPLFLMDSSATGVGTGDTPLFFELGEGPCFSEGDEYLEDPSIALLSGTEPPKPRDPAAS
ncbi:hypothetical protein lerEdw1_014389 [Lerista edwardsae]|nr:hypothetical protein lerEdw1_014389 [Lerista edwardsae]